MQKSQTGTRAAGSSRTNAQKPRHATKRAKADKIHAESIKRHHGRNYKALYKRRTKGPKKAPKGPKFLKNCLASKKIRKKRVSVFGARFLKGWGVQNALQYMASKKFFSVLSSKNHIKNRFHGIALSHGTVGRT